MSKGRPRGGKKPKSDRGLPGAVGGPGTGHGVKYQLDYAVFKTLDLISRCLCSPYRAWAVRIEPRIPSATDPTQWDLGIDPPGSLVEVKLNPSRQEIVEWLHRVTVGVTSTPAGRFALVYSKGGGTLLPSLGKLIRNAGEAGGDRDMFRSLLNMEGVKDGDLILQILGNESHETLRHLDLELIPEATLLEDIPMRARLLAGAVEGKRLVDFLFRGFADAMPRRMSFPIRSLIAEIGQLGIRLHAPPTVDPADLSEQAGAALVILQSCPTGLPLEVLARAIPFPRDDLEEHLAFLLKEDVLIIRDGLWSLRPLSARIEMCAAPDLVARTLEALLGYIDEHSRDAAGRAQVRNAIRLAGQCVGQRPGAVRPIFRVLEKLLKRMGDKRLVLEVAQLAIDAARRAGHSEDSTKVEAHALICGRSWVYQRIQHLEEARVHAGRSLELGECIGWDRNTAYCQKCMGRICRIAAEHAHDDSQKEPLLAESISRLEDAIARFSNLSEFGPCDPEVGECHSLLARTHLVAGRIHAAKQEVADARRTLVDPVSKDYLDLKILEGDLAAAEGDRTSADEHYEEALAIQAVADAEKSEILARAYYRRGLNRAEGGQVGAAVHDLGQAAEIWRSFDEHRASAMASWAEIEVSLSLPQGLQRVLEPEPLVVRVAAVREYQRRLAAVPSGPPVVLRDPGPECCEQIVREAKRWVAIHVVDW